MNTTTDYSNLQLTDESELYPFMVKMGQKEYRSYMERLFKKVDAMNKGDYFMVDNLVSDENREMFIKMLCLFIWMNPGKYSFNLTFTMFTKRSPVYKFQCITFDKKTL